MFDNIIVIYQNNSVQNFNYDIKYTYSISKVNLRLKPVLRIVK